MILAIILYAILGSISGLLAGLLGISGGVVTVPCLFFIFRLLDFPLAFSMQVAIGTSLAAMVFNTFSSTLAHSKKKAILWDLFKGMLPGIILGSLLGAYFGDLLSSLFLELLFGIFACLLGIQFLHPFFLLKASRQKTPNKAKLSLYGLTIAFISNILGIGGGVITVPTLLYHHIPERRAIGTSAATGFVITFFGALFYLYFGLGEVAAPHTIGFIYLPAFIVIGITSSISAVYGAFLTQKLSPPLLRRLFGVVLILVGLVMFFV